MSSLPFPLPPMPVPIRSDEIYACVPEVHQVQLPHGSVLALMRREGVQSPDETVFMHVEGVGTIGVGGAAAVEYVSEDDGRLRTELRGASLVSTQEATSVDMTLPDPGRLHRFFASIVCVDPVVTTEVTVFRRSASQ